MLNRLRSDERGIALVMALGIMVVLAISITSVIDYTASTTRTSARSKGDQSSYALAEAGVQNAESVLAAPNNEALNPSLLTPSNTDPLCPDGSGNRCFQNTYSSGTANYYGTYDAPNNKWTIKSWGKVRNATGTYVQANGTVARTSDVVRAVTAQISVVPDPTQPQNATAWNYIFSQGVSNSTTCDMNLVNSVVIDFSLYVEGNLCLQNSASVQQPFATDSNSFVDLSVGGKLAITQPQNSVGTSSFPLRSVKTGSGCTTSVGSAGHTCTSADKVWASSYGTATSIAAPVTDHTTWYANGVPGPKHPCTTSSGTPPAFNDPDQVLNLATNGSNGTFNLTPGSDYSCITTDAAGKTLGQLSWNATTKVLTVFGAMYFDGSMSVTSGPSTYTGSGTIYLTGTFSMGGGVLCVKVLSGSCNTNDPAAGANPGWDPNATPPSMLIVDAHGNNGSGRSVTFAQSTQFQGGLFGYRGVDFANATVSQGPVIGSPITIGNSVTLKPLPYITKLPLGAPGNPNTHATPESPKLISG